jgi:HK97 family phage prohead protease
VTVNLSERGAGQGAIGARLRREYRTQFEVRAVPGQPKMSRLAGYASVYEAGYQMWDWAGEYTEVMRAGSGKKTLSEDPAVQLLLNHTGLSMAYTRGGTLSLVEDATGLAIDATVNTTRTDVRDMVTAIEDGNVDEMSFAFRVMRQQWSPDWTQRDILEYNIDRGDTSVVNFGANPETSIALRGQDLDRMEPTAARALMARLAQRVQVVVVDTDPDDDDDTVACPACGAMNDATAAYCDQCGVAMQVDDGGIDDMYPLGLALALDQAQG